MDLGLGHLTELKRHLLNEALREATTYDATIAAIGKGVARRFEQHCGRRFGRLVDATFECPADREPVIVDRYPIESISAIALRSTLSEGWVDQGTVNDIVENIMEAAGIVHFGAPLGVYTERLRLTYTGGFFYPTGPAPTLVRGTITLELNQEVATVTFDSAFDALPVVVPTLNVPEGGTVIALTTLDVSVTGFTVRLASPALLATYTISWVATEPVPEEEQTDVVQVGRTTLALDDETKAITFGSAFGSAPVVVCVVESPSGGFIISAVLSAVTGAGFTALLGYPIPATGYKLTWIAAAAPGTTDGQTLPDGATALPDDLKLAWLLQCEFVWKVRDKLGLSIGGDKADAAQLVSLSLAGLKLVPDVEQTLNLYRRMAL